MFTAEYKGINSFLVNISKKLLKDGICRETRGVKSWELPYPIIIAITNPLARYVTLPIRKWNVYLPYAESLWLASGRNDLGMIADYLPKMKDFSDDGLFLRGGYGPRLRKFNGNAIDYESSSKEIQNINFDLKQIDQIQYVVDKLTLDKYSRQAVIYMGDPVKDLFDNQELKTTKDFPCTCLLQFQINAISNKLDLTVYLRSNDLVWGATAVNIFNYTFIQEYIAQILGVDVGCYYHIANNLHYYEYHKELLKHLAEIQKDDITDDFFVYEKPFTTLAEFDSNIKKLTEWESSYRKGGTDNIISLNSEYFNDWAKVLATRLKNVDVQFKNPILTKLIKE